jgi:hypothetical protein
MNQQAAAVVAGFPITAEVTLRRRGEHEGLQYEISNHGRMKVDFVGGEIVHTPSGGTWCYYVTVSEAQLSPELFTEFWLDATATPHKSGWPRISYDYYGTRFSSVEWHGGVTFYEKLGGIDGAQRYVKIGCDFAHSWDDWVDFDYAQVEREAIETVKQLQALYQFRRRCPYFGTYHDVAEMIPHPKTGALYSADGIEACFKEFAA